uniref:Ubiquitin fusion degradation protein 1 homolog n=1 Tax=Ananas comosus var. bracteatus TaxID=296719 RepID=A0A6V7PVU2_ANACO|nr:unnamed protein product [Ananas comosus var. bracteatus]
MEENMLLGNGIVFSRLFEALPYDGSGDKIKLPPSCFKELSDQGPWIKVLCTLGVLEFTARENSAELPPHVWTNLFPGTNVEVPLIEVHYASLPKGTYAKLKPEAVGFSDLPNHKAILETTLRKHATLSEGDVIMVYYGELQYKLRVLELKPSLSVSILETDIEVDIEGSDSVLDNENEQHVLIPLVLGKAESGIVEEGKFKYYKFSIEETLSEKVSTGLMNIEVKIEADTSDGDTNIYVSRHPLVQHQFSTCPLRLIVCRFCGDMVQAGTEPLDARDRLRGLSEHESICGSRTAPCDSCGRSVMLKEMDIHVIAVHQKS